jgi:lambda family phage portal protein
MRLEERKSLAKSFFSLRADYDAARPSIYRRTRIGIIPQGTGADWHIRIQTAYFQMVELARELMRNNVVLGQAVRRMTANIVQGGFIPAAKTGDRKLNRDLQQRWADWANDKRQCSQDGTKTFWDLEKLMVQHTVVDGDVFALPTREGRLWCVENHRCRTPVNAMRNRKTHAVHGIVADDDGRPSEYWITNRDWEIHQSVRLVSDITKYPAYAAERDPEFKSAGLQWPNVLHLYRPDRLSMTRGVTALAAPADTCGMMDDLAFAQLVKAQAASCYTFLHEYSGEVAPPLGAGASAAAAAAAVAWPPVGVNRGVNPTQPGQDIYSDVPGEKITGFSPAIPNQEFFQHASLVLTFISINLDLPLCVFLLDPSNTNFSGWRGAMDQAKIRFRDFQKWLSEHFHRDVWKWRVRCAMAEDRVLRAAFQRLGPAIFGHDWHAPTWPYIQPLQDVQADMAEASAGLNSRRRIMARNGLDIDEVDGEILSENYRVIRRAKTLAARLNSQFADDGQPVHYRELMSRPFPEGMTFRLMGQEGPQSSDASTAAGATAGSKT